MSITKPYALPRWSTSLLNNGPLGSSNRSEPDEIKKDSGFNHGERPQRQTFNWLQYMTNEWITYFDKQWESAGQVNFNFSQNLDLTTGLNFAIDAGTVTFDGVESVISSSTLTLNPNSTTVIGFNLDALTISQYTSGSEPTSDFVKLFVVTTNASAITVVDDRRTFFQVQSRLQSGDNTLIIDGASDTFSYTNNGVSVIHATNAGNIGLNTANPFGKLHVKQGSSGAASVNNGGSTLVMEHSTTGGFTILTPNNVEASMFMGDPQSSTDGGFQYNHANLELSLRAGDEQRVFVNGATGNLGVGVSGAVAKVHIKQGPSGYGSVASGADGILIEDSTSTGINIQVPNTQDCNIAFGDPENAFIGGVSYLHAGDILALRANGNNAFTINSLGDVGINTAGGAALARLHVRDGDSGASVISEGIFVENSGNCSVMIGTGPTSTGSLIFADTGSNIVGSVQYDHAVDKMHLGTAGTIDVTIDSDGNVGFGTSTPLVKVHIQEGTGSGASPRPFSDMFINSDDDAIITLGSPNTRECALYFSDPENNNAGSYRFDHPTSTHHIAINGVDKVQVNNTTTTITNDLSVSGNLTVNGTVDLNASSLSVDDNNITLNNVISPDDTNAVGGGITVKGTTDKTILWSAGSFNFSENLDIPTGKTYKINNTNVLTDTTLGSNVVNSSLTSVGTLDSLTVSGSSNLADLTLSGNLTVNGTTTTINSTIVTVDDKNIEIGSVASPTDVTADGGGITLKGTTDKTINWTAATGDFDVSENWDLASGKSYKINNVSVLNGTTLGGGVTDSSLTSVGTLSSLTVSGNVGIGVSPSSKLTVKNSTGDGTLDIQTGTTTADSVRLNGGGSVTNWLEMRGFLGNVFFADTTEVMRTSSTGLGIGVTNFSGAKLTVSDGSSAAWKVSLLTSVSSLSARNHTDTSYVSASYDALQHIVYQSGTEALRIAVGGKVGINESTPLAQLHVKEGESGVTPFGNTDTLFIEHSSHAGITIGTPNNREGSIFFADPESNTQGGISYSHSSEYLAFRSGNIEGARLEGDGDFFLNSGRLGVGISPAYKIHSQVTNADNTAYIETVTSGNSVLSLSNAGVGGYQLLAVRSDNSFRLKVEGGAERLFINSAGNLGIGADAPLAKTHIKSGASGITTAHLSGDELVIEGAGHTGITITSPSSFNGHIYFSDLANQNTEVGLIRYAHTTDTMDFWTGGTSRVSINNTGQLMVKDGTAASPGVAFSSDPDTGIYSDTNNVVKIAAGGSTPANFGPNQSDIRNTSNTSITLAVRNDSESYSGRVLQIGSFTSASSGFHHIYAISDESAGNNTVFTVKGDGQITSDIGSISTPGADYAEMFEWLDGNIDNEDRVGYSVSLVGAKIKIASIEDVPVGVISGAPTIIGDGHELSWSEKWLTDDFGRRILDENGSQQYSTNYDPDAEYIPRSKRKEWSPVGLMGKLVLRKGQVTAPNWIKLKDINDDLELWLVR